MNALSKRKFVSFSMWSLLALFGLMVAGWEFGCKLMALFFSQ